MEDPLSFFSFLSFYQNKAQHHLTSSSCFPPHISGEIKKGVCVRMHVEQKAKKNKRPVVLKMPKAAM